MSAPPAAAEQTNEHDLDGGVSPDYDGALLDFDVRYTMFLFKNKNLCELFVFNVANKQRKLQKYL